MDRRSFHTLSGRLFQVSGSSRANYCKLFECFVERRVKKRNRQLLMGRVNTPGALGATAQ